MKFSPLWQNTWESNFYTLKKAASTPDGIDLQETDLKKLPQGLFMELLDAVVQLDSQRCLDVVSRVSGFDETLADRLRTLIETLQYREILKFLDTGRCQERCRIIAI